MNHHRRARQIDERMYSSDSSEYLAGLLIRSLTQRRGDDMVPTVTTREKVDKLLDQLHRSRASR